MNRSELVAALADRAEVTRKDADAQDAASRRSGSARWV